MSSLTNALAILSSFERNAPELGVSELAERLGLPKSSISRLMSEMEREGFLERTPSRRYKPGAQLLRLGSLYKFGDPPIDRIDTAIREALKRFPATGYIAINRGVETVILRMRESQTAIRFVVPEGSIVPAFTVAIGKAIMARMTDQQIAERLPEVAISDDPYYRKSREALIEELQVGRQRHYFELFDMAGRAVDAVATTIAPADGDPIGFAFSFVANTPAETKQEMIEWLLATGQSLGQVLGDPYWRATR